MSGGLDGRPVLRGLPVPFACETDDGDLDHAVLVKRRAIRCALSRICGICGSPLTRPIAFIGPPAEVDSRMFAFPPLHLGCARAALKIFGGGGGVVVGPGHLGQTGDIIDWSLLVTGGFELIRPKSRGGPVAFHPNSVIEEP